MSTHLEQNKSKQITLDQLYTIVATKKLAVASHSSKATKGGVFVVLPAPVPAEAISETVGGEKYLSDIIAASPAYIVLPDYLEETIAPQIPESIAVITCENTRKALGKLATIVFGTDKDCPKIVGITGTNGKTTESYLLQCIFEAAGFSTGILGTIAYTWPGHTEVSALTTPGSFELHNLFAQMAQAKTDIVFAEVSSHAIDQERIAGIQFSAVLITNVTQDHLDYHKTLDAYFATKRRLFLPESEGGFPLDAKVGACNADDPWCRKILEQSTQYIGYGFTENPVANTRHLHGSILSMSSKGMHLKMHFLGESWEIQSPLVGSFNAMNLLGAQALALSLGITPLHFSPLEHFVGIPGRMERIFTPNGLNVFVDYAHTPDALRKAQNALQEAGFTKIITVFGCGGDRDRAKRPLMGEAVAQSADIAVVTSDNPRTENPETIIDDIMPGLAKAKKVYREADRKKAIALAVSLLQPNDALLVAGKGHEEYQIIGTTKYSFSDKQVLQEATS